MEVVNFLATLVLCSLTAGVWCNEDIALLNDRLDMVLDRINSFEDQISIDKAILINKEEERILSLKAELRTNLMQNVKVALTEILRSESFEDIIKSEVVSEMRHLKRTNHQMRRQLHQMMTSLGQVREDNRVYGEALLKGERQNAELMSCSKHYGKSEFLTVQLAERDRLISELQQQLREQNGSCTSANTTKNSETSSLIKCSECLHFWVVTARLDEHDNQINELNRTLTILSTSSTQTSSTTPSTTTVVTALTTRLTTPDPQVERSRILVAPLRSSSSHQLRQLNIHSNSLDIYSYFHIKNINSLVYISKLNSLLIGLYSPYKIISSKLFTSRVVTVRHNVGTNGMAADEKRGILFLTTYHPSYTISRMSLQGRHYTAVVSLVGYGIQPRAIAVHPDTQMIYSCNYGKLFSVRYDGSRLTTLDTGSDMHAVTLDISNSLLYYSNRLKLMKMSLSTNTTSEVTEFSFNIWNLLFYRGTVYYISHSPPFGTLGAVDVGRNSVSYTLQTVNVSGESYFSICLIP